MSTLDVRHAFVDLYIGDEHVPINTSDAGGESSVKLLDLSYTLRADIGAANALSLRVLDPSFEGLEKRLIENRNALAFRFGWRAASGDVASPRIPMIVKTWTMEFVGGGGFGGTVLSIEAHDHAYHLGEIIDDAGYDPDVPITDVVKDVIERAAVPGVAVRVDVPTKTVVGTALNLHLNMPVMQYVRHLLRFAIPDHGLIYRIRREPTENGIILVIDADRPSDPVMRRYVFARDRNGEMLSFAVRYNGAALYLGGERSDAVYVDPESKDPITVPTSVEADRDDAYAPRHFLELQPSEVSRRLVAAAVGQEQLRNAAVARRRIADSHVYEADASVVGDPGLTPHRNVQITVVKGRASDSGGLLRDNDMHHTSGTYFVREVVHSIAGGIYRTTLTLQRNSGNVGPVPARMTAPENVPDSPGPGDDVVEVPIQSEGGGAP